MNDLTTINGAENNSERMTPIETALQIDGEGRTTTKNLYGFLELDLTHYSRWCKTNILDNPYAEENTDYWVLATDGENLQGGRPSINYKLTADFAKKLAMVDGSPKGEEARNYFIRIEQNAKRLANNRPQTKIQILAAMAQQMADQEQIALEHGRQLQFQESRLEQVENKIEKRLTDDFEKQLVTPTQLGKMFEPALSANSINKRLQTSGLQWRVGGEWVSTVEGKKYSSSEPVQLDNGKMVYQLKWQRRVKELI